MVSSTRPGNPYHLISSRANAFGGNRGGNFDRTLCRQAGPTPCGRTRRPPQWRDDRRIEALGQRYALLTAAALLAGLVLWLAGLIR